MADWWCCQARSLVVNTRTLVISWGNMHHDLLSTALLGADSLLIAVLAVWHSQVGCTDAVEGHRTCSSYSSQQWRHLKGHMIVHKAEPDDNQSANRRAQLHHTAPTRGRLPEDSGAGRHCSSAQHMPLAAPCHRSAHHAREIPRQHRRPRIAQHTTPLCG